MKCFYCLEEISETDSKMIIAIEVPYVNLNVHRSTCYREIVGYGEREYLQENAERIYAYASQPNQSKKEKKRK